MGKRAGGAVAGIRLSVGRKPELSTAVGIDHPATPQFSSGDVTTETLRGHLIHGGWTSSGKHQRLYLNQRKHDLKTGSRVAKDPEPNILGKLYETI